MNDFVRELSALPLSTLLTLGVLFAALVLYAVLGGADYGGGVWDLLASGPRAGEQRRLIETAIGPVWEANHVWLIFMIVLLFTAFPPAFAALSTALHIPLTLMLLGIVLRGTSFTFRQYDRQDDTVHRRWGRLFAISSVFTPLMLGICIGAISTGGILVQNGFVTSGFLQPWLAPFPFAVGLFALLLFAFLAAVYLTVEAEDEALREDFRRRALVSAGVVGALALTVYLMSQEAAPLVRAGLTQRPWSWPLQIVTGVFAAGTLGALWRRHFHLARVLAVGQVALILTGWALALYPFLVPPDISITEAAAPLNVLRPVLWGIAIGLLILVPSLLYLFRVFKGRNGVRKVV
ncbi:MAG TPA: cytochrome d ubiquinol oxidase subunit II [Candidatus Binatia bacterium]|jgi:cytochrome d ubiquinol oxidase subunit II|nr:cytochrome d ubiquinol oxidase subunit II [Candidatus Binatia bacterium]